MSYASFLQGSDPRGPLGRPEVLYPPYPDAHARPPGFPLLPEKLDRRGNRRVYRRRIVDKSCENVPVCITIIIVVILALGGALVGALLATGVILGGGGVFSYTVRAEVTLTGVEYSSSLANTASAAFTELADLFCAEIESVMSAGSLNDYYSSCTVHRFRNGSVMTDFTLSFEVPPSVAVDNLARGITEYLTDSISSGDYFSSLGAEALTFPDLGTDIDQCALASSSCDNCVSLPFSYRCYCNTGSGAIPAVNNQCPEFTTVGATYVSGTGISNTAINTATSSLDTAGTTANTAVTEINVASTVKNTAGTTIQSATDMTTV